MLMRSNSQGLTATKTLDYINNKLSDSKYHSINIWNPVDDFQKRFKNICLTNDGKVSITETFRNRHYDNGVAYDVKVYDVSTKFYVNDIDISFLRFGSHGITITCKSTAPLSKCIDNPTAAQRFVNEYEWDIDDENVGQSIYKAMAHLLLLLENDTKYMNHSNDNDPFASKSGDANNSTTEDAPSVVSASKNIVSMMKTDGGIYEVPAFINGVLKISFVFDSGASDISISPDVASTLIRTGTISKSDYIGIQKYRFADGSTATSKVFNIHQLKIGDKILRNVRASISESIDAPMLLGQSVLQRFGKFTIDNNSHTLTIE